MSEKRLGIIGGSGFYGIADIENLRETSIETFFGKPSAPILTGEFEGNPIAFLNRHGKGHTLSPTSINYRANILALKKLNVNHIISISACGSLRDDYQPGDIVIPDQLYDHTTTRPRSFFNNGLVAHINVADPFCRQLSTLAGVCAKEVQANVHTNGTSITIEGPRFSTRAESNTYRAWGMSIIGMTTAPEAFLAREAEICYTVVAHVTDYDVWHKSEDPVSVPMVTEVLKQNLDSIRKVLKKLIRRVDCEEDCACRHALHDAIISAKDHISTDIREQLAPLLGNYFS